MSSNKDVSGANATFNSLPAVAATQPHPPQNGVDVVANSRTEILRVLMKQTRCAPLPTKWQFLRGSRSIRQIPTTTGELEQALRAQFSIDALLAAGMFQRGAGDAIELSPVFGGRESTFAILYDSAGAPIDALSSRGQLSHGAKPAWLAVAAARHEQWFTTSVVSRLLVTSDDDLSVMHKLNYPFTPASGLESLSGNNLRALWSILTARGHHRKFTQTLAGWQIGKVKYKPALQTIKILQHLVTVPYLFAREPPPVDVWLPSVSEFDGFRRACKLEDPDLIKKLFDESLYLSRCSPARALVAIGDRAETDYLTARKRLELAVRRSSVVPLVAEVKAALSQLEKAFEKTITNPFLNVDDAKHNIWERWPMLAAGEITKAWFEHLDVVVAARKILSGQFPSVSEDEFEVRLRLTDSFAKLHRLRPPR